MLFSLKLDYPNSHVVIDGLVHMRYIAYFEANMCPINSIHLSSPGHINLTCVLIETA